MVSEVAEKRLMGFQFYRITWLPGWVARSVDAALSGSGADAESLTLYWYLGISAWPNKRESFDVIYCIVYRPNVINNMYVSRYSDIGTSRKPQYKSS